MLDTFAIAAASPDFAAALDLPLADHPPRATPRTIHDGVSRLRGIRDRRDQLVYGLRILHEMLYLAECPEDFLTISTLIPRVRDELQQLGG